MLVRKIRTGFPRKIILAQRIEVFAAEASRAQNISSSFFSYEGTKTQDASKNTNNNMPNTNHGLQLAFGPRDFVVANRLQFGLVEKRAF